MLRSAQAPAIDAALATLDRAIAEAAPDALPPLVTALSSRTTTASTRLLSTGTGARADEQDRNLGVGEAAALLGVSVSWLYRRSNKLPFVVRLGRRLLFSARGLDRWNQQRTGRGVR